jgi:dGTP triphosphohydrolase
LQTVIHYCDEEIIPDNLKELCGTQNYNNKKIYGKLTAVDYYTAIIDYIAGMTDKFAVDFFNAIITFS